MANNDLTITLEKRAVAGKKVKNLRRDGQVPGVVYGQGFEPISVQAPLVPLQKLVKTAGKHHPVQLNIAGSKKTAMIKEISMDPVKNLLRHVAFHAVRQDEKVTADIPVVLEGLGESPAERAGLVILTTVESLQVKAFPGDLPNALTVSTSTLSEAGQHLTVADLSIPSGVEIDAEPEQVLASVYEPSALQAANEAAGGEAEAEAEEATEEGAGEETGETPSEESQKEAAKV
ncbi:ribosomal 5S rRNA E-loop binding protein Ctc/L25/TL5 [candidate division TM7 genomosp. GTL1]|nr:ribosomal 5S rRNA E-loop binding protein Ctc/L25/TL5 [candidate division TM7 genomosp. GTL1]